MALSGNQAANGENKHEPKYREKPFYSNQGNPGLASLVAVLYPADVNFVRKYTILGGHICGSNQKKAIVSGWNPNT